MKEIYIIERNEPCFYSDGFYYWELAEEVFYTKEQMEAHEPLKENLRWRKLTATL